MVSVLYNEKNERERGESMSRSRRLYCSLEMLVLCVVAVDEPESNKGQAQNKIEYHTFHRDEAFEQVIKLITLLNKIITFHFLQ